LGAPSVGGAGVSLSLPPDILIVVVGVTVIVLVTTGSTVPPLSVGSGAPPSMPVVGECREIVVVPPSASEPQMTRQELMDVVEEGN
jgi:hypothetical protein